MFLQIFQVLLVSCAMVLSSPLSSNKCNSSPFSQSANDLGFRLTNQFGGKGNLFISPLSIYTALSMTYLGSRGNTAEQMERTFNLSKLGLNGGDLHKLFQKVLQLYSINNNKYSLSVANGLFLQKGYTISQRYMDDIRNLYQGEADTLDFANNGVAAQKRINSWVADKTRNKIDEFLKEPLDPQTKLALLNAVYFKGTWKSQFSKDNTHDAPFYKNSKNHVKAKMMNIHKAHFQFYIDHKMNYKFLELPYDGQDIAMLLALPRTFDAFPELEMTSELLCEVNSKLQKTRLDTVSLPKFHLEYEKELKDSLAALGIKELFSNSADLTGISKNNNLQVSSVLHKAVVDVNEEGSEAAGVTGVIITEYAKIDRNVFVANHPFLFYIVDKRNGLVLFSGRLVEP